MTRRPFLHNGPLLHLAAGRAGSPLQVLGTEQSQRRVRIGLVTDLHYADKPPSGTRYYRETLTKFAEAAGEFQKLKPDFVVELGDLIDAADSVEAEKKYLATINKEFAALPGDKHYVLGNHCVATLTKDEFLEGVRRKKSHFSFDAGGHHFVVLDACFRADGQPYGRNNFKWNDANIPEEQVEWLRDDLRTATGKAIVL